MIDLDEDRVVGPHSYAVALLEHVRRALFAERRSSTLVRARLGDGRLDFRITYLGPSRPRRNRRAAPDDGKQSKEQHRGNDA